jgi:hypothetical protein
MKSQPDPDTTADEKFKAFETDLAQALKFSKADLRNAENWYKTERIGKPKRGPKPGPRSSSSARVCHGKG